MTLLFATTGLALGTPGPPMRGGYFGVIVRGGMQPVSIAHEAAHFLALQHVQNVGVSGMRYPDPIDDTTPGSGNMMESGTQLTRPGIRTVAECAACEVGGRSQNIVRVRRAERDFDPMVLGTASCYRPVLSERRSARDVSAVPHAAFRYT